MEDGVEDIQSILSEPYHDKNNEAAITERVGRKELDSGGEEVEERSRPIDRDKDDVEESPVTSGSRGVGIINNLISTILHPHHGEEAAEKKEDQDNKEKGVEEKGVGDKNVLLSGWPAASGDEIPVPEAEEASLLIHSIVHD